MKRLLLDTNIYGELILDKDFIRIKSEIQQKAIVHGFKLIREELRAVPKKIKLSGKNLRIGLLHIYDEITKKSYQINEAIINLGKEYYKIYRKLGGSKGYAEIINDFRIVACGSIHQIDIVVSEDNKSMLTKYALKSYDIVNTLRKLKTPRFISYLEFKRWLI